MACDLRVTGTSHRLGGPQGSMLECPVREPCSPKCCYPDMRRSNPTCEASGTTALLWKHRSGCGPAEDGGLNARERPWLRSVIGNRPKVLTGRRQKGTRVGSTIAIIVDGDTRTRRTIGRSRPIRISTLNNRVSPIRSVTARWRYPTARKEMAEGVKERRSKRRSPCNGADRASARREYPTRKGADFRHGLNGWEDVQHFDRWRR
jgi:hypothetical protein